MSTLFDHRVDSVWKQAGKYASCQIPAFKWRSNHLRAKLSNAHPVPGSAFSSSPGPLPAFGKTGTGERPRS